MRKMIFIFPLLCLLAGCSDQIDVLSEQQSEYEKYFADKHVPRLLSEQQKDESLDQNPEYYAAMGDKVYRYIRHIYDPQRETQPQVAYGDRVTITFRMYEFTFNNIDYNGTTTSTGELSVTMPFYSNDPVLKKAFEDVGLNTEAWNFEPLEVELGRTQILKGLELALPGCRQRDTVEVYMTYNMAYGKKSLGVLPKESPVAVFFSVDSVIKN